MKYSIRQYAETLYQALKDCSSKEQKEVIRRFLETVRKNGDSPRLELIVRAFQKKHLQDNGLVAVDIEMAQVMPESVKKEIKSILGGKAVFSETVDAGIGGGIRITVDGELLIDASAARQMNRMLKK